jgi:malonyl CoA-acyl carrier protein transacylase
LFQAAGARMYMPLPVSAAFHSRYMVDAANEFADFLAPMTFSPPAIAVVANVTAEPYPVDDASAAAKSLLVRQISHSVLWTQSVRSLLAAGVEEFREMGPGNVLGKLVQQIRQSV